MSRSRRMPGPRSRIVYRLLFPAVLGGWGVGHAAEPRVSNVPTLPAVIAADARPELAQLPPLPAGVNPTDNVVELPPLPAVAGDPASAPAPPTPPTPVSPVTAEMDLNWGAIDLDEGRYGDALKRLERADRAGAGVSYYRGLALLALKRSDEALRDLQTIRSRPDSPDEVEIDLAAAQLQTGQAAQAEETLRDYLKKHPDDPFANYFLGVALYRQKRFNDAITQFEKPTTDERLKPFNNYYRGLAQAPVLGIGATNPANPTANGAPVPPTSLTRQLNSNSAAPGMTVTQRTTGGGPDPNRRWNLAVINGYEYDTDVALAPNLGFTPNVLTPGNGHLNDSRWTNAVFGEYRLIQTEDLVVGLIGSTYDTWQFRLDRYNFQDYMGGIYSNAAIGESLIGGLRYEFHEDLLGGKQFATDHRFAPNLTYREGTFGHLTAYYEFESLGINPIANILPNVKALNRSGNINSVGVTQAFYLMEGAGRLFLGYRYDRANTQGTDFDRSTNQLDIRLEMPLFWKMIANVEARYFWDDYLNPNSLDFYSRKRYDTRIEARAGVQKFFTNHLSTRLEYVYTDNQSNVHNLFGVSPYSYNRNVLSLLLIYDF